MKAIIAEATARDLRAVRLDVIDRNAGARRLYERFGFIAGKTQHLGPLAWVFGFRSATQMELCLPRIDTTT